MESSCGNRDKRTQPAPAVGSAWARACSTTPSKPARDRLKATGVEIADADIERLSPLGTDHINPPTLTAAADARAAWMKRAVAPVSRSSHELSIAPVSWALVLILQSMCLAEPTGSKSRRGDRHARRGTRRADHRPAAPAAAGRAHGRPRRTLGR
jgi:hypothetical protein